MYIWCTLRGILMMQISTLDLSENEVNCQYQTQDLLPKLRLKTVVETKQNQVGYFIQILPFLNAIWRELEPQNPIVETNLRWFYEATLIFIIRGIYFRKFNPLLFARLSSPKTKIRPKHSEGVVWAQYKCPFWPQHPWKSLYRLLFNIVYECFFFFLSWNYLPN